MPLLHKVTRFISRHSISTRNERIPKYISYIEALFSPRFGCRLLSNSAHKPVCSDDSSPVKRSIIPSKYRILQHNKLPEKILRRYSSTTESSSNSDVESKIETLLETWFYEVSSRGSMSAHLPFTTIIKPLPPQDYPDMNKVIIELHYEQDGQDIPNAYQLSQISDIYDLKVSFDQDKANMNLNCNLPSRVSLPVVCHIQIPLQFELNVHLMGGSHVTVESLESPTINVETHAGNCNFKSIKSSSVTAISTSGNITSRSSMLGNVSFHTGQNGSITATKLQGTSLDFETESGNINIKAFYCGEASFKSISGDIHLGNCHGNISLVSENSVVKVGSLEGDLDVSLESGQVDTHLSKHKKAVIRLEDDGDVTLSFPEGLDTSLDLDCNDVIVDKNVKVKLSDSELKHEDRQINRAIPVSKRLSKGFIGKEGGAVTLVKTKGNVHLKQLDWIETTKLAMLMNREDQK